MEACFWIFWTFSFLQWTFVYKVPPDFPFSSIKVSSPLLSQGFLVIHIVERKWKWKLLSHVQLYSPWNSPGQNTGVGSLSLRMSQLAVIFCFPGGSEGNESACNAGDSGLIPGSGRSPWRRKWQPTPVFLPRESPWTAEPGWLQSMGSQRIRHDWATECQ